MGAMLGMRHSFRETSEAAAGDDLRTGRLHSIQPPFCRQTPGDTPYSRLNARLKAASDS
jgi:hypothetical protein